MKKLLLSLAIAGTLTMPALYAQVQAVNVSGDYVSSSVNFTNALSQSTGDYDFDGVADDRRTSQDIDTVLTTASGNPFATGAPSRTSTVRAGFQVANINSVTNPTFGLRRIIESGTTNDATQVTNGAGTTAMRLANVVNVAKANFLGGAASVGSLSFANQAGSAQGTALTMSPTGNRLFRLVVQNGANWFISSTSLTTAGTLTLNGFTESWFAYDPSSNIFYDNAALGTSVLGSTFNDIQAFGGIGQTPSNFDGTTINTAQFAIRQLSLTVVPEPGSLLLLSGGLAGFAMFRRLKKK